MNYFGYYPQLQSLPKLYPQISDFSNLRNQFAPFYFTYPQQQQIDLKTFMLAQIAAQKQLGNLPTDPLLLNQQLKVQQEQNMRNYQLLAQMQVAANGLTKSNDNSQINQQNEVSQNKPKGRSRRLAHQIERLYTCPVANCKKSYGSEGSLGQHIKLKHPNYYASFNLTGIKSKVQEINLKSQELNPEKVSTNEVQTSTPKNSELTNTENIIQKQMNSL